MKLKFSKILALSITVFFGCISLEASAQDGGSLNEYQELNQIPELNLEEDKTLLFEGEIKSLKKDTIISKPVQKSSVKGKSSDKTKSVNEKEEDALSFNFLYYIIQKFKYSDLLDQ